MLNFGGVLRAELNPWTNRWCVEIDSSSFSSTEKMDINISITIVHFEFVYLERPRIFSMMQSSKKCLDLKKFGQIILGVPWDPWDPLGAFRPRSVVQDKARSFDRGNSFSCGQENISHLGKRKVIFKSALVGGYVSTQEGTLPTTKSSPLKFGGWETTFLFGIWPVFRLS